MIKNKASRKRGFVFIGQILIVFCQIFSLKHRTMNDIIEARMEYSKEY